MQLRSLIKVLSKATISGDLDQEVRGITADSRDVMEGYVFIAVRGNDVDGQKFISQAIENGACAIVSEVAPAVDEKVCWAHVSDARAAVAALACEWNEHPSSEMKVVGITGTNGKTTTAFITHAVMKSVWMRAGLLGTVQVDDGENIIPATHTTPGAIELQKTLGTMINNGCRGVAMEISSHALEQKRTDGLLLDVAVFSNLSQDHLDYHGDMDSYFNAKRKLFELLEHQSGDKKTTAVINLDDPYGQRLVEEFKGRLYISTYGRGVHADMRIGREKQTARGTEFEVKFKGREYLVRTPYIGRFNIDNCTAALAACCAAGIKPRDAAVRELRPKRLITVFGCGGDRDRTKRPQMGKAAASVSDLCIVTSDNPRSESPSEIIKDIEKGMVGKRYEAIPDRMQAIQTAVNISEDGDVILIAGKGHETYQEISGSKIDFDDRRAGYKALNLKKVE